MAKEYRKNIYFDGRCFDVEQKSEISLDCRNCDHAVFFHDFPLVEYAFRMRCNLCGCRRFLSKDNLTYLEQIANNS